MTHRTVHETDIESAILALQRIQETIIGRMSKIESPSVLKFMTEQCGQIDDLVGSLRKMRESEGAK